MENVSVVVWENEKEGPVVKNGDTFEQSQLYKSSGGRIIGIVKIEARSPDTYGKNMAAMTTNRQTFAEVLDSPGLFQWRGNGIPRSGVASLLSWTQFNFDRYGPSTSKNIVDDIFRLTGQKVDEGDPVVIAALFQAACIAKAGAQAAASLHAAAWRLEIASEKTRAEGVVANPPNLAASLLSTASDS